MVIIILYWHYVFPFDNFYFYKIILFLFFYFLFLISIINVVRYFFGLFLNYFFLSFSLGFGDFGGDIVLV